MAAVPMPSARRLFHPPKGRVGTLTRIKAGPAAPA
jgi:hypothetical protein